MAKRRNIGVVYKGRDGKPDSIKITEDVQLKKGQYVNLENEASEIKGLDAAVKAGALDAEYAETRKEQVKANWNKVVSIKGEDKVVKDMVRFNLVVVTKEA